MIFQQFSIDKFGSPRRYIREGSAQVKIEGNKKKKYYLFLFNDILLVTKPKPAKSPTMITKFTFKLQIILNSDTILDTSSEPPLTIIQWGKLRIGFLWRSEEEKKAWEYDLSACVELCVSSRSGNFVSQRKVNVQSLGFL